jgi:DNA polymerase-3 subunit delta
VKLTPDNIAAQLKKQLAPVYFVSGDEPLIVGETIDAIRLEARRQGYEERESYAADARFDWDALSSGLDNLSLFSSRKIVEVRLTTGKPGRQGAAAIVELVSNPPPDTLFVFSSPKIDKRTAGTKWAQSLQSNGVWVEVRPLPPERLPAWLGQRMRIAGLECDNEALEILAARTEGNLLAAQQEISKLELLADGQHITAEFVRDSVADGARFDVFQLADAAVGQDAARALRMLYGLRKEGVAAALCLWALAREANALVNLWARIDQGMPLSRAMNETRIWSSRQGLYTAALRKHNEASIRRLLAGAGIADKTVKGARQGLPWNALLELVLLMAQPDRIVPTVQAL